VILSSLILGILLIFSTEELFETLNYVMVSIFAIIGVVEILHYLFSKKENTNGLFLGIVAIWLSLFTYHYYTIFIIVLPIILSLYAFILGANYLHQSCNSKHIKDIIPMIISFLIGVFLIFRPWLSTMIYFKITGIYIILITIFSIVDSIIIKNKLKKIK